MVEKPHVEVGYSTIASGGLTKGARIHSKRTRHRHRSPPLARPRTASPTGAGTRLAPSVSPCILVADGGGQDSAGTDPPRGEARDGDGRAGDALCGDEGRQRRPPE